VHDARADTRRTQSDFLELSGCIRAKKQKSDYSNRNDSAADAGTSFTFLPLDG